MALLTASYMEIKYDINKLALRMADKGFTLTASAEPYRVYYEKRGRYERSVPFTLEGAEQRAERLKAEKKRGVYIAFEPSLGDIENA